MSKQSMREYVFQDWDANVGDLKSRAMLITFRLVQWLSSGPSRSYVTEAMYRVFSEIVIGTELRPKTRVGRGLTIHHGFGLVVNDHAVLGSHVTLRNGVVIGNKVPNGPCPVLEDHVQIGANAVLLGGITVGHHSSIGAGAVVTHDVPPFAIMVGNPARELPRRQYLSKRGNETPTSIHGNNQ